MSGAPVAPRQPDGEKGCPPETHLPTPAVIKGVAGRNTCLDFRGDLVPATPARRRWLPARRQRDGRPLSPTM